MPDPRAPRVGVLLGSQRVPAWAARTLALLTDADDVEVATVACAPPQPPRATSALYAVYERFDRAWFGAAADGEATVELASIPGLPPTVSADALDGCDLDVLLAVGVRALEPQWCALPRHGVWVFDHELLEAAPFFGAMARGDAVAETRLRRVDRDGQPDAALYASFGRVDASSLARTRSAALWKAAEFPLRCLRAARRDGWDALPVLADGVPERDAPGNAAVLRHVAALAARFVRHRVGERLERPEWFVALHRLADADPAAIAPAAFAPVPYRKGRWWADPFVFADGGGHWLFVEELDEHGDRKGVLAAAPISDDGVVGEMRVVLARDYHLSYPFVFRVGDARYLLPETRRAGRVELYRAVEFPWRWELDRVLIPDVNAVDPTLFEHDGTHWLFVNQARDGAAIDDELHLYFADSPFGPFAPHPRNPVVSDVRRARPAGRLFRHAGAVIRPSQDSSVRYGFALAFNRVDVLTRDDYRETTIRRIEPDEVAGPAGRATHTYNRDGAFEVLDAQVMRRR